MMKERDILQKTSNIILQCAILTYQEISYLKLALPKQLRWWLLTEALVFFSYIGISCNPKVEPNLQKHFSRINQCKSLISLIAQWVAPVGPKMHNCKLKSRFKQLLLIKLSRVRMVWIQKKWRKISTTILKSQKMKRGWPLVNPRDSSCPLI